VQYIPTNLTRPVSYPTKSHDPRSLLNDAHTPPAAEWAKWETIGRSEEHRNNRSRRSSKRNRIPPLEPPLLGLIIVGGDYHYAKNRSSFKEYHRIKAKVGLTRVIGIGKIELLVERKDGTPYTLVLEDVLHTPSAICNGFNPS